MKKGIGAVLAAVMLLCSLTAWGATDDFTLNTEFQYPSDGEYLQITGTTAAKYGQTITVYLYNPEFVNGVEDVRDENGQFSNPAERKPMTKAEQILRVSEVRASQDGSYSARFSMSGIAEGTYMIVKASGAGRSPASASALVQFRTKDSLNNVTLPALEKASASELGALLVENQLVLGISLGEDYQANKDLIHTMFVAVREEDIDADPATGKKFNSIDDVKKVFQIIDAIRSFPSEVTQSDVSSFIASYKSLMNYDFSKNNAHYTLTKTDAQKIAANILNETAPKTMSDVETAIAQGVALAVMNTKDSTTIAPVIEAYSVLLGLDKTDYALYCEKYGTYEVNKAFVDRNFEKPSQVAEALKTRIGELETEEGEESGKHTTPSSGKHTSNSGGLNKVLGVSDALIQSDKEKEESQGAAYIDLSEGHWAHKAVKALSEKGIIGGYPDGSFKPEEFVTREQLVKMILLAFDKQPSAEAAAFSDLESDRWSAGYIQTAVECGIVNGMPDGSFGAEKAVSREDAAVMLLRACKAAEKSFSERKQPSDSDMISSYAAESVETLLAAGIISGFEDGSFRPAEKLTRAQATQLIYGLLQR